MKEKIYDKANSILELHGVVEKRKRILRLLEDQKHNIKDDDVVLQKIIQNLFVSVDVDGKNQEDSIFYLRDHVVEEMSRLNESNYLRYLRYRYSYDIYPSIKKVTEYPPLVQIEPASICNYRCVFCYQIDNNLSDKKNGHMGVMSIDLFKDIVDQLEGNVEGINLASRGEPTVNKNLSKMLDYIAGKFLAVKVNTNAYLLDEEIIHAILGADLQTLVFSVDAASDPLYSQLRVNGDLDRVVENIEKFHKIKEVQYPNSKLITRVSGVKYSDQQSLSEMKQFWERYVDQVAFVDYNPWENIYDARHKNISIPCSDLWRRMFVWWDGRVAPCDVDYLTTLSSDSVLEKTIPDIWQGNVYTQLRKKHMKGDRQLIEPCTRCVVV